VADLQEARRRMKSPAIQTLATRVDCGESIINVPGLAGPFPRDEGSAREYAGLLADTAVYMRLAASDPAARPAIKKTYIEKEVAIREKLLDFLKATEQASIREEYFRGNLLALADAMERAGMASRYHQLVAALNEESRLDLQAYRVWVKAVRSCALWDFKSTDNRETLRQSLCNSECIEDLNALYAGLQAANLVLPDGTVKKSMPIMPIPAECEIAPH
jgi:hypothetical protein